MRGDTAVIQLTSSATGEVSPRFSPDGRWLAYLSTESGTPEIYVSPFPDFAASRVIVSQSGGTEPVWSRDGRELFYATATGTRIVAAKVETSPTFRVLERRVLFVRQGLNAVLTGGSYDVTPDGKRFLMYGGAEREEERFVLVLNWAAEIDNVLRK
jgi:serine/threonine-protein kinase